MSLLGNAFAITKNDSTNLAHTTRGLYVGASGDVKIDTSRGDTVTLVGLAAGVIHPIAAKKVYSTGTSATGIIGFY